MIDNSDPASSLCDYATIVCTIVAILISAIALKESEKETVPPPPLPPPPLLLSLPPPLPSSLPLCLSFSLFLCLSLLRSLSLSLAPYLLAAWDHSDENQRRHLGSRLHAPGFGV